MTTRREKVLQVLFPRNHLSDQNTILRYDEDSERYVEDNSEVLVDEDDEEEPTNHTTTSGVTCSICLESIPDDTTSRISGLCKHVVRY